MPSLKYLETKQNSLSALFLGTEKKPEFWVLKNEILR